MLFNIIFIFYSFRPHINCTSVVSTRRLGIVRLFPSNPTLRTGRSQCLGNILGRVLVQRALEWINVQLEESSFRCQRQCFVVNLVDLFPVVRFGHQTMTFSIGQQMLESFLDELTTLRVHNIGGFLFESAQIWFHIVTALSRWIDVELDQVAENVFVEADNGAVRIHGIVELHLWSGPAQVRLGIGIDSVLVNLCGVQLVGVERPVLSIGDDRLGGQWIGDIIEWCESLIASLTEQPSEAAQNCLSMNRFLIVFLAIGWIAKSQVAAAEVGNASKLVMSSRPITFSKNDLLKQKTRYNNCELLIPGTVTPCL